MGNLADRTCTPCHAGTPPLDKAALAPLLGQLRGWRIEGGKKLAKSYRFGGFVEAVAFVDAIVPLAEAEGHHPDLFVQWGEVGVFIWTHAAGGLTENDFVLAAKIDRMHEQSSSA